MLPISMVGIAILFISSVSEVHAQDFSDIRDALVDYAKAEHVPGVSCASLNSFKSKQLESIKAETVAAAAPTPAFCRVTGVLDPEIAFAVALPARWNGRFYMFGNGGLAGEGLDDPFQVAQRSAALQQGFAVANTNTGHYASKEPGGTFVLSNPRKAIDYAYRAVHLTALTARAITKDYYARPVSRAYWNSCSNGGRQGLIEAQRYPEDFDGIVVKAPWLDQTGFTIGAMWNQRALNAAPVTESQMKLVAARVMAKCDAVDGLRDGLISDPRQCDFNPARDIPACPAQGQAGDCLTAAQAETVSKIYDGPVSGGRHIFPGFEPGSEAVMGLFGGGSGSGWMNVILAARPGANPADFDLAENIMRYLVHKPPMPDYDYRKFDFDHDIHMLDAWGRLADAKQADLSLFRERGGKLLMSHGWADAILQPRVSVDYYQRAEAANGPDTRDFFRLFMVPGMAHCGGGTGPDQYDQMTAIINWVERGQAPDSMQARQMENGKVTRSRPLCPFPEVARYVGKGSIDEGASFHCTSP